MSVKFNPKKLSSEFWAFEDEHDTGISVTPHEYCTYIRGYEEEEQA